MTSLATQLQAVASAAPREERLKGKASLLYELREAADIDLATIYAVGVQGFTELCRLDGRFETYQRGLFSRQASETNRELQDREFNAKLDLQLDGFFKLLSGYFASASAAKCLEFLIRRMKIHVFNVEQVVTCALPYHATPEFVKLVQLANLTNTSFYWLKGVKDTGAAPPRNALVARCRHDAAFLSFVCEAAAAAASNKGSPGAASAFYAVLLAESLAAMPRVTAQVVPRLLPYLEAGLAPGASAEQYAGALMVACQLASVAALAAPLTEALLEGVAKGARAPLHAQSLQASLALCQTQGVTTLPTRAFKHLVKLPDLPGHLADLCRGYRADSLTVPLVVALAESASAHQNYERVLVGVVTEAPLSAVAVTALVAALVRLAVGGESENDSVSTASKILRLVETRFPVPTSSAVDALLAKEQGKAGKETSGKNTDEASEKQKVAAFLRRVLAGSAAGPMPGDAACSLAAALDHPLAGLRESALRELGKGAGLTNANSSLRNGSLSQALLRRVVDDHPGVAAAAVALPFLRLAINDDAALFDAAAERLLSASAACAGKTNDAESERAVAKRCVTLACATLATPGGDAGGSGETTNVAQRDDSDSDSSDDEKAEDGKTRAANPKTALGALAGKGAALAFGHLVFSPCSRAVARAVIASAKRNKHPTLCGLRGTRFKRAMENASVVSSSPGGAKPKTKPGGKDKNKQESDPQVVDKETRVLMDAASTRAVVDALAEGLGGDPSVWSNGESLTQWTLDAWRDGSPRTRATLLLALRRAAEGGDESSESSESGFTAAGVANARVALWGLLKNEWFGDMGGGSFINDDLPSELPEGSGDGVTSRVGTFQLDFLHKTKPHTFRQVAKHDKGVVSALARSALRQVCADTNTGDKTAHQKMLHEAFDLVAVSSARARSGSASKHSLDATMETVLQALGDESVWFLAQKAAEDPEGDAGDTENANSSHETPRVALELLATRDGESSKTSATLAALVAACASSDPATRAAAARAVVSLAPSGKGTSKSAVHATWTALAAASARIGDTDHVSTSSARAATSEALALGLRGDATGNATRALLAPAVAFLDGSVDGGEGKHSQLRLSARGAARLVATLRGAGCDSVKAEALAPALERALALGGASTAADVDAETQVALRSADAASLATEILATYTPTCAKSGIGQHAWRAFSKATRLGVDAAPAPARVAATSALTAEFVQFLPPSRRRATLRSLFVAVAGDPDAGARAAARDAVDVLDIHAEDISALLVAATAATRGDVVVGAGTDTAATPAKKTKTAAAKTSTLPEDEEDTLTGARAVGAAIAALEVLSWKRAVDTDGGVASLVPACHSLLTASLDAAERGGEEDDAEPRADANADADVVAARAAASGGYAQALLLSTLEALAVRSACTTAATKEKSKKSKKADTADDDVTDSFWDVPLVVRAVRDAEAGPARDASLSLLAALAKADPKGVMRAALEVSAALTHSASDLSSSEDASSRRALEQALGAVVPAWIAGGLGMDAACDRVIDALPDAPQHRRASLCVAFLRATETVSTEGSAGTGKNPGLPVVLASLLSHTKSLELAAELASAKLAAKSKKRAQKAGGALLAATNEQIEMEKQRAVEGATVWVGDLVATLLAREAATNAVDALVRVSKLATTETGRLEWLVAETAAKHLSSRAFVAAARREAVAAAAAHPEDEQAAEEAADLIALELQRGYAALAENALVMIRAATADAEDSSKDAKLASRVERGGRRVLGALDGLLAPGAYLNAIAPLLEHTDPRVRRKALRLVAHRLRAAAAASVARGAAAKSKSRKARSRARAMKHRQASRQKGANSAPMDLGEDDDDDVLEEELVDEVEAATRLAPVLASLAVAIGASAQSATRAAALGALEAAAVRFSDASSSSVDTRMTQEIRKAQLAFAPSLLKTVPAMVRCLSEHEKSRAVVAAAANALAAVMTSLGPRCVPVLPEAVPALFAASRKAANTLVSVAHEKSSDETTVATTRDETETGAVLVACLRAVNALMAKMGGFLSPHLADVLALLLSPSLCGGGGVGGGGVGGDTTTGDGAMKSATTTAAEHAAALREALPRATPPRLLLAPLGDAMRLALGDEASGESQSRVSFTAAAAALRMAAVSVSVTETPVAHRDALIAMLLRALDVRRDHPREFDATAIDAVEKEACDAFVRVASTLTESAFAPTLQRFTEWAKARADDPHASTARLSALFRVASALADALRGVFAPLATPILDLAASALDPAFDPASAASLENGTSAKKRKKEKKQETVSAKDDAVVVAELDAWRMKARALGALRRIVSHENGDLLDTARFNQLHPLVTRCLTAEPPKGVSLQKIPFDISDLAENDELVPGGVGHEASQCIAQLIASAPDDMLWKPAHRGVLLATRDPAPRARRVALAALLETTNKLQEEYLVLLPEAIPFLSELFEDPDENVEAAARTLTATLAELSGEDLKSLMAGGGE